MPACVAEMYFINANTLKNKDLTDFLERNIDTIVRIGRLTIKPVVVEHAQIDRLTQQGIQTFPAMRITGCPIFQGMQSICNEIERRCAQNKRPAQPKTAEENVSDWMMKELNVQWDPREKKHVMPPDDDEENLGDQLRSRFTAEQQRRAEAMASAKRGPDHANGARPAGPSWQTTVNDDRGAPPGPRPLARPDNLRRPVPAVGQGGAPGDPQRHLRAGDQDDEMMRALMNNMGGGEF